MTRRHLTLVPDPDLARSAGLEPRGSAAAGDKPTLRTRAGSSRGARVLRPRAATSAGRLVLSSALSGAPARVLAASVARHPASARASGAEQPVTNGLSATY